MGTSNAFYVRAPDPATAEAIRAAYPDAYTEKGSEFFAVDQADDRPVCPESELQSLSARLKSDVVWLSFQSVVDAFKFHHWRDGNHVRSLTYGCLNQGEWERVEGDPEPWEAKVIFGDLPGAVRFIDDPAHRQKIERVYRGRIIERGAAEPSLDARETARGVAEFYVLPGWSLAEDDVTQAPPPDDPAHLNYASPPPPRPADPRRLFMYLLPGAICVGAVLGSWIIESRFPAGDSRNFGGVMCALIMAPLGVVFGALAVREAFRPKGLGAFCRGLMWNAVIAFGPWLALWVMVQFGLLKRGSY